MGQALPLHVAIVDDDPSICRSFGRLLRAAGMTSLDYPSAEAFLADTGQAFDCLVLDVQLGGMSGIELGQYLATSGWRVPIIYISAHDDPAARHMAQAIGARAFFKKTDRGADVLHALRAATGGA